MVDVVADGFTAELIAVAWVGLAAFRLLKVPEKDSMINIAATMRTAKTTIVFIIL
jgi:hypothetical protein